MGTWGLEGEGIDKALPLEVLLEVMRRRMKDDDLKGALEAAKAAAPYLHGRVASARPAGELSEVPDDELEAAWRDLGSGGGGEGDEAEAEDPEEPE